MKEDLKIILDAVRLMGVFMPSKPHKHPQQRDACLAHADALHRLHRMIEAQP
jgi:hypothetical protein